MTRSPPALTVDQMREVDRAMVHDFHIGLEVMMENAGGALAELAHHRFQPRSAVVLTGPGGNGGGGLVAARHLSNRGVTVHVVLSRPAPDLAPVTALQLDIVQRTGLAVVGELYLADISVPQVLYERMGVEVGPLFADGRVLKLRAS